MTARYNDFPRWLLLLLILLSGAILILGFAVLIQYLVPTHGLAL